MLLASMTANMTKVNVMRELEFKCREELRLLFGRALTSSLANAAQSSGSPERAKRSEWDAVRAG